MTADATPETTSRIYLDNNATTRPFPEVLEVMAEHFSSAYANPGSSHAAGRAARRVLEDSREQLAAMLGAKPQEVTFTSGGTESSNLALFGLCQGTPGKIALTAGEHPATVQACVQLEQHGWQQFTLPVDAQGRLITADLDGLPWDDLKLVTIILAHNETGVIQDIEPLATRCHERQIPFHLDAVQAVGKIPVDFHQLGVTTLALGAHKFHGPRGIGALLVREGTRLAPYLFGGHQETGRRPGTEPVALIAGMTRALSIWHAQAAQHMSRVGQLRDQLESGLLAACESAVVHGREATRLPNTLNIAFPGLAGEALLVALDLEGVACSLGSTCASGSAEPAPVLVAMGCPQEVANASVRFSLSPDNTAAEIQDATTRIATVVNRLRGGNPIGS